MKIAKTVTALFSILFLAIHVHAQGTLTPPGAPAPGMKTLDQVEPRIPISSLPFAITNAGSYYLATSLTGTAGQHGITVNADDVSIDLMGYALVGATGTLSAIFVSVGSENLSVGNGTIRSWGADGIDANNAVGGDYRGLRMMANEGVGLSTGDRARVIDCHAEANYYTGFYTGGSLSALYDRCLSVANSLGFSGGYNSICINSMAISNTTGGVTMGQNARVENTLARANGGSGIAVSTGSLIRGCVASGNGSNGLSANNDGVLEHNVCLYNGAAGIRTSSSKNVIRDNVLTRNGIGLRVESFGSLITGNRAVSSTSGTNFIIAVDNKVGVIVAAPNSLAIGGSTGGSGLGTTDPWANFSF